MKIYFREEPETVLETVLRTPNRTYSITYNFTTWTVSIIHFVWVTNERIELYRNYELIGSDNGAEAPNRKPVVEQEYIMVFGNYNFSFNAISTQLKYIEAWRIPFNSSQMEVLSGKNNSTKSNSTQSNVLGMQNMFCYRVYQCQIVLSIFFELDEKILTKRKEDLQLALGRPITK